METGIAVAKRATSNHKHYQQLSDTRLDFSTRTNQKSESKFDIDIDKKSQLFVFNDVFGNSEKRGQHFFTSRSYVSRRNREAIDLIVFFRP